MGKEEKRREGVLNSIGMKLEVDCVCVSASFRQELFQILEWHFFGSMFCGATSSDSTSQSKKEKQKAIVFSRMLPFQPESNSTHKP